MSLTDTEKEWIEALVENVSRRTADAVVDQVITTHIALCPHGKRLTKLVAVGVGIAIGAGALGSELWKIILSALHT